MSDGGMFSDLPATFPEKDKYKKRSIVSSLVVHSVMIGLLLLIPLLAPQTISQSDLLIALVMTIPPPPPPPPPAPVAPTQTQPKVEIVKYIVPEGMVAPTEIPKEIARIIDQAPAPAPGVVGGTGSGRVGGVIGGLLAQNVALTTPPPPPPPPPPPVAAAPVSPIRVGGSVQEPRILKLVQPVYPALAARARIAGTVILDAVVTAEGTVDEVKVISGHPLLIEAAINCVRQWQYEPTLLNGTPVPVILTAKVSFNFRTAF